MVKFDRRQACVPTRPWMRLYVCTDGKFTLKLVKDLIPRYPYVRRANQRMLVPLANLPFKKMRYSVVRFMCQLPHICTPLRRSPSSLRTSSVCNSARTRRRQARRPGHIREPHRLLNSTPSTTLPASISLLGVPLFPLRFEARTNRRTSPPKPAAFQQHDNNTRTTGRRQESIIRSL